MYEFRLPDIGEGIHEAELVEWLVAVGDRIAEGDDVAVINTDKVTVELPAPCAGLVLALHGAAGEVIDVGSVLAVIDDGQAAADTAGAEPPAAPAAQSIGATLAANRPAAPVVAAPALRRLAAELGVDLARLAGSGPDGRILRQDVEAAAGRGSAPDAGRRLPLGAARAAAARHLAQSVHSAATSTTSFEVMGDGLRQLIERRGPEAEALGLRLGPLAPIAKCVAAALARHERFNATIDQDGRTLILHDGVDLGVAVAAPAGLVVPVLRGADRRPLMEVQAAIAELSLRARDNRLGLDDLKGGSFTLSSTGGLERATIVSTRPIINPPQTAILWVSRIVDRPRVIDGRLEAGPMMAASLSFDHRFIDGAEATAFINDLAGLLQDPEAAAD